MRNLRPVCFATLMIFATLVSAGCSLSNDRLRVKAYDAYRAGEAAQAREQFETIVARDATDYKSHYYLGMIGLDELDEPDYARRHFEIAYTIRQAQPEVALAPQPGTTEMAVPFPTRHQIVDGLAEAIYRGGNHQQLFAFLKQVSDQYGEPQDYLRQAKYLRLVGDHDGARFAYIKAARAAKGTDPAPYYELGEFLDEIGARDQALLNYRRAYYIDPDYPHVAEKIRAHGLVPGPTVGLPPEL